MTGGGNAERVQATRTRRFLGALALGAAVLTSEAAHAAPRVDVHGGSRIDAHAARSQGKVVLSGTVVDDTGRALPQAHVLVAVTPMAPGGGSRADIALASAAAESCSLPPAGLPSLDRADRLSLPTDDAGRFCVRLALPSERYVVHLETTAAGLLEGAKLDVPVDPSLLPVTLRFDPERTVLSLDDEATVVDVIASTEDDGVTSAAAGLPLTLSNETGAPLGTATTDGSGRARFVVDAARLGPPGRGELRVAFVGSADAEASTHSMPVERRTRVDLVAPDATGARLPPGSPEEGIEVRLLAVVACARRGCAGAPTGTVEALSADAVVGAAPVEGGAAHVVVTFSVASGEVVPLRVRYLPDAPWFLPGPQLSLEQPVRAPSPWKRVPLLAAGLGVALWLALARMPRRASGSGAARKSGAPPRAVGVGAHVELVRAGPSSSGWTGRLLDAHDGRAVGGARVAIERPGFEGIETVAQTTSEADGRFALGREDVRPGDELVVEGRVHATIRRALPPAGELQITLVLRRRALLERLVAWARRRGRPFDAQPDATPGHVRRAAGEDVAVARWADAIERAAFGGGEVDRRTQEEVDRLAPPDATELRPIPEASPDGAGPPSAGPGMAPSDDPGDGPR